MELGLTCFCGSKLNTIISLLATTSKSLIALAVASALGQLKWHWFHRNRGNYSRLYDLQVFDDGSRGPLGAARLAALVSLRSLALPGALLTICLIVIDPSAQQLLTYSTQAVMTNSSQAWVPQARNLTDPMLAAVDYSTVYSDADGFNTQIGQVWLQTFYQGILSGSRDIETVCPTGNCTWPPFHSISWRPTCRDVTANISTGDCVFSFDSAAPMDTDSNSCNVTISDALPQKIYATRGSGGSTETSLNYIDGPRSIIFRNYLTPQISMTKVDFSYREDEMRNDSVIVPHVESATECQLIACVQQYSMTMISGQLNTHVLSFTEFSSTDDPEMVSASVPSASGPGSPNITFKVMFSVYVDLAELTDFFLSGNVTQTIVETSTNLSTNTTERSYFLLPRWASSDILSVVLQYHGFETTMKDIASQLTYKAHSMSNYRVAGAVGTFEAFVHVHWPWLALPVLVALSGSLFLGLTIFQSATKHVNIPIWKSSILPVLPLGHQTRQLRDDDAERKGAVVLYPSIEVTENGEFRIRNQNLSALEVSAKAVRTVPVK